VGGREFFLRIDGPHPISEAALGGVLPAERVVDETHHILGKNIKETFID
jgi:hypothetical protein